MRPAEPLKLAVAATAPFGADVLERLAANHEITSLLTRPDAPRGRGQKTGAPPAKETAERLGIRVLQPARPEPGLDFGADTIVVAAYGLLIPEDVLEAGLWLNVHPSLLPRWRGAAPVERAVMAGAARVPDRRPRRRGKRLREVRADCGRSTRFSPARTSLHAAGGRRRDVRGEDYCGRSRARLERTS